MQPTEPALVLKPEEFPASAMDETPATSSLGNSEPDVATSDERLMVDFSNGQATAFDELFRRYKQPIFGFFRRRVADAGHAEELAQETFLAVLRGAARYKPQAQFRTYLYAIALQILRGHRRRTAFRAAFLGQWKPGRDPAAREESDAALMLRQALGKLERMEREMLMLREFEQLSYVEIAELLKIPVNTVRSRLFRARLALRQLLEAPATEAGSRKLSGFEERA
jgi:RNA polymerase sigma-70 factor, ECF subfamily